MFLKSVYRAVVPKRVRVFIWRKRFGKQNTIQYEEASAMNLQAVSKNHGGIIANFDEYDEFIRKWIDREYEGDERSFLYSYNLDFYSFVDLFGSHPPQADPFSDEYRNWEIAFFEFLSGKSYDFDSEQDQLDVLAETKKIPTIYWSLDDRISYTKKYTEFIAKARPMFGERALEMGCGRGNMMELLGRCGCQVTGLDISQGFLDVIENRLMAQNINAKYICGTFYDLEKVEDTYDLVVFEASFHHCGQPIRLMEILHKKTSPNVRIYFINEPFHSFFDRPWGMVRYDGMTIACVRGRGWMDFGYRPDFFEQLLHKTGFKLRNIYPMDDHTALYEVIKTQ